MESLSADYKPRNGASYSFQPDPIHYLDSAERVQPRIAFARLPSLLLLQKSPQLVQHVGAVPQR